MIKWTETKVCINADNTQTRFKNGQCSNKGKNVAPSWAEILDILEGEVQVDGNQQPNNALNSDSVASVNNIAINQQLLDDCARDSNSEKDWFNKPKTVPCDHQMIDEPVLTGSTEDVLAQPIVESDNIVEPMEMDIMDPSLEASPASPAHFEPIQQREPSLI